MIQTQVHQGRNKLNRHGKECEEKNFFSCLNTTARSQGKKEEELEILISEKKLDIIGIMETWWDPSHDWNVKIIDYIHWAKERVLVTL